MKNWLGKLKEKYLQSLKCCVHETYYEGLSLQRFKWVCFHRSFDNKYYHSMPKCSAQENLLSYHLRISLLIPLLFEPASQPEQWWMTRLFVIFGPRSLSQTFWVTWSSAVVKLTCVTLGEVVEWHTRHLREAIGHTLPWRCHMIFRVNHVICQG